MKIFKLQSAVRSNMKFKVWYIMQCGKLWGSQTSVDIQEYIILEQTEQLQCHSYQLFNK